MPDDKDNNERHRTLAERFEQDREGKKETTNKCSQTKTCYDLLRPLLGHSLPEDSLGLPCGGSSGRCVGLCDGTSVPRNSFSIHSSSLLNPTTKIIRLPNPRELTFPNYLKYLAVAIESVDSDPSDSNCPRFPLLMEPPPPPPHKWPKRYRIALWKGVTCGGVFLTMDPILRWLWGA